jgi:hypothetical protein
MGDSMNIEVGSPTKAKHTDFFIVATRVPFSLFERKKKDKM